MKNNAPSLIEVTKQFATEEQCIAYLEALRWPEGVECVGCTSKRISKFTTKEAKRKPRLDKKTGKMVEPVVPPRHLYECLSCGKQFSAGAGTIFNDTHLPLSQWFLATALMLNAKKGLSAKQMQRDLGVNYRTAWYLCHRIRKAMDGSSPSIFTGTVEADATFVGGKLDARRQRAKYGKQPVFGIVQRGVDGASSKVFAAPVLSEIKREVLPIINSRVAIDATIYTDDHKAYQNLHNTRTHAIVVHSKGEYVNGDCHSNSIENFWSLFKRGLIGQFHQISVKHLGRYLAEFQFRFNNRDTEDMFALVMLNLVIGSALEYKRLISGPEGDPNAFDRTSAVENDEDDTPF
jgi:transposase-like protein/DNA-directed RNA polymerase subunit RPC12/RpoP